MNISILHLFFITCFFFIKNALFGSSSWMSHRTFIESTAVTTAFWLDQYGGRFASIFRRCPPSMFWGQCAMHAFYVCVPLAPRKKRTRYCVQPRTGWVIFSLFCFVAPVLIAVMTANPLTAWGGFHGTQHLVFRLSHFNATIFRADNFCNCLNSSCPSFLR